MLELQLDSKVYGGKRLFDHFSLSLRPGEFLCLLGPSGCGKTTLINLLAGLDRRFQGQLKANGSLRRPGAIGYMFQQPRLLPWYTVTQNLELVAEPARRELIEPMLASMGLSDSAGLYPNRLSLGMARRVALARALINRPQLLLMDEPFVSLDPPTAKQMRGLIQQVRQQHPETAMVLVTHDLEDALELADRILVLGDSPTRVVYSWPQRQCVATGSQESTGREHESLRQQLLAHYRLER
ncbi:ABC transporter ATP-binding protein [Motiliproteus coralliicola]|uniref:ABC transporter ATP-binding protein n=1 Tax=Motiliproteus coralliicola TaxID=2283196 RepID=A0A369WU74_9GAMM|nr:ABC transporter ATP-binding protein [Motiliproteus coralliicola]RDE25222.1 ABC transporter ATP-binding protein [Motiliproteus coralliicola]